jgi:hypothetical protein
LNSISLNVVCHDCTKAGLSRPTKLPHLSAMLPSRNCSTEELSVMSMFGRLLGASELLCGRQRCSAKWSGAR